MKPFRLLVLIAGAVAVLLLIAAGVAFNSTFQTWAVRRAIAGQPGLRMTIGSVSADTGGVQLKDVRLEQAGVVLKMPALEADFPLLTAGWSKEVLVSRLVAKGWTLDLTTATSTPDQSSARSAIPVANATPPTAGAQAVASPAAAVTQAFAGIFAQLELPMAVSVDGVQLEGDVILPDSRGRAKVSLRGGGLGGGREGRFDFLADASLTSAEVHALQVNGTVVAAMDTPRTFTRLAARFDASAHGMKFPNGVKLHANATAAHLPGGETYSATVVAEGQDILNVQAEFPRSATKLAGTWKLDVRDADIAPFVFGEPLPAFAAEGTGTFDSDATFEMVHVAGRLETALDRLQVILPEFAAMGALKISADFDVAERDGTFAVRKLDAAITAAHPVATVRALQAFEINPETGELRAADTTRELLSVALQGLPLAWVKPFFNELELEGGLVRGEFVAAARSSGLTFRSTTALTLDELALSQAGQPMVRNVDVALNVSGDYTPQGWQAEIAGLTAKSQDMSLFSLDAKVGQLAGDNQPIKATGKLSANLPAWLAQPAAAGRLLLTRGDATIDFVVSLNKKQEIQAILALKDLATGNATDAVPLPSLVTNLRADIAPDGTIAFNAPIAIERGERKSDVILIGTIAPEKNKLRAIDAQVTSTQLVLDDARILLSAIPGNTAEVASSAAPSRDAAPPWAGFSGSLALQLKSVIYSETFQMSNVTGRLKLDAGKLKLEDMQAGLGESGRANLSGSVTFDPAGAEPYTLAAEVAVREFDPGPLLRAMNGSQPATVEGKFDITSALTGHASTLEDLAAGAGGNFQVTSKGGVFRGLPVNVGNITETTGKIASLIASAGTAISAMTGKKDAADIQNKAQAVAELARGFNPIPYDQLSVMVSRDADLNTTLESFSLISPEMRLTGSGTALHQAGSSLLDDALAMEFTLRARGRQGDLLKYLGILESQTDDLGYAACTVPLKVGGTLGKPDASELNNKLAALALEKSGVTDKAAELVNKIFGGGK